MSFDGFDVGDGPAAFVSAIGGALVTVAALLVELRYQPPLWVHLILWLPLTVLVVVGGLRLTKGWLLAREYAQDAREGRRR